MGVARSGSGRYRRVWGQGAVRVGEGELVRLHGGLLWMTRVGSGSACRGDLGVRRHVLAYRLDPGELGGGMVVLGVRSAAE